MMDLFGFEKTRKKYSPGQYPRGIPREVCEMFDRLALDLSGRGFSHYSSDAILHLIRWHHQVERGNRTFKANDHWTAKLSRWFVDIHPELDGFFEMRVSQYDEDAA